MSLDQCSQKPLYEKIGITKYNQKILDTKNNRLIARLVINRPNSPKYILIRNELVLADAERNIPYFAVQGEDIPFLYTYGKFNSDFDILTSDYEPYERIDPNFLKSLRQMFHPSGRVVFGNNILDMNVYENIEDIREIKDPNEREIILKLFNDIRENEWLPR